MEVLMEEKISGTETEHNNILDSGEVKPFLDCWPDLKWAEDDGENKLVIHARAYISFCSSAI